MAVAVVGQQDRVAQPLRGQPGVAKRCVGVEPGADDQDWIAGGGVPGAGVAVGAGRWPGRARGELPAHDRSADAAEVLQAVHHPQPDAGGVAGGAVGAHQRRALLLEQHSGLVGGRPPGDGLGHRGVALDGRLQRGCGHGPQTRVGQAGELEGGQRLSVGQLPGRVG